MSLGSIGPPPLPLLLSAPGISPGIPDQHFSMFQKTRLTLLSQTQTDRHTHTNIHIHKKNYAGVITLQAWIRETETELSDSKVLTLPGGFEPTTA